MSKSKMTIMLRPGGKSGYADYHNGQRCIFRKATPKQVGGGQGQRLLATGDFVTVAPSTGPAKAQRSRAAALVDRLAGMDGPTMDRFEALMNAAQTGPTMAVAPEPPPLPEAVEAEEAPAVKKPAAKRKTATKKKGGKRTLQSAKG